MSDVAEVEDRRVTKRDLVERGIEVIDKKQAGVITVSRKAGGIAFSSMLEVMEFAKLMATAGKAIPEHLQGNAGACLAITFQAIEWGMSPFQVANKSYEVNNRVAWESQLVHAVIEARAPLQRRLECEYEGEGPERVCTVTGIFVDGSERPYTSPKIKDIKPQNSPLWKTDPDQQLWYYSSRSWARKWCPDVLLGIYTREELEAEEPVDGPAVGSGLASRLAAAPEGGGEGFQSADHANRELASLAKPGAQIEEVVIDDVKTEEPEPPATGKKSKKKGAKAKNAEPEPPKEPEKPAEPSKAIAPAEPKTADEYIAYAREWIKNAGNRDEAAARWDGEKELRDQLQVPVNERIHLTALIAEHFPLTP